MKKTSRPFATRVAQRPGRLRSSAAGAAVQPLSPVHSLPEARPQENPPSGVEPLPLSRAKGQWVLGEWSALVALDSAQIARHPERDRLALLAACAHQQRGHSVEARELARKALEWGCDRRLVARLLISGLHNTLGRIAALKADDLMLERHFTDAMVVTEDAESNAATHTRAIREMADMGLLPQAARLLESELARAASESQRPIAQSHRLDQLRSELDVVKQELALAQMRSPARVNVRLEVDDGAADSLSLDDIRARSTSQLGQDLWVLEQTNFKRNGFFVEFGATDGVRLSNTFLLEQEFGWRGICAEPNPRMFEKLQRNRRCLVTDACLGATSGDSVEFVLAEEFGGMVNDMTSDMHAKTRLAYYASAGNRVTLRTESLNDLLIRLDAPREIDYISVDTEGSEFEILRTFPFERWQVRLFTIEHNFTPIREDIRQLLEAKGYRRTESQWDDWYQLDTSPR